GALWTPPVPVALTVVVLAIFFAAGSGKAPTWVLTLGLGGVGALLGAGASGGRGRGGAGVAGGVGGVGCAGRGGAGGPGGLCGPGGPCGRTGRRLATCQRPHYLGPQRRGRGHDRTTGGRAGRAGSWGIGRRACRLSRPGTGPGHAAPFMADRRAGRRFPRDP